MTYSNLETLNADFGFSSIQSEKVEKEYQRTDISEMRDNLIKKIEKTISAIENNELFVERTKKDRFKNVTKTIKVINPEFNIIRNSRRDYGVKFGYGAKNEGFVDTQWINKDKGFAPIVGYLNKSIQLIKEGLFDNNLQELLVKYRERAEKGIQAKKDKKNAEKLKLAS